MSEGHRSEGTLGVALREPARTARPLRDGDEQRGGTGPLGEAPVVRAGWLVGDHGAAGPLRLVDCSPVAKLEVRADPAGPLSARLAVAVGRLELFEDGILVASPAPGEWLALVPAGSGALAALLDKAAQRELVSVVDVTHGRALLRLSGTAAREVLSRLCGLDLGDAAFGSGRVAAVPVAGARALLLRDDLFPDEAGLAEPDGDVVDAEVPSYLICVDRSVAVWLGERLHQLGRPLGLEEEGYLRYRRRRPEV